MRKVLVVLALVLVAATGFARGRQQGAELGVGSEESTYISPNASSGVQDSLTIPISVGDSGRRVVIAYELVISSEDGTAVWSQAGVDESERPGFFGRLMEGLGLRQRETTLEIPESVQWGGTYLGSTAGTDGASVPDGQYQYVLTVTDDRENVSTSEPGIVVVDNTPPTATVSVDNPVFSPNGDGRKDTATITQTSSTESSWTASLTLNSQSVLDQTIQGSVSATFTWDGRNLADTSAEDGVYVYTLSSTDLAGNSFSTDPLSIEIDTADRPLTLVSDTPAFSPNGDGSKDTVALSFGSGVVVDGLESATLTVVDADGDTVGSVEVGTMIGSSVLLNGYLDESRTQLAPEGVYQISASAVYDNGTVSDAGPLSIEVDITPPSGSIEISDTIFSPEGDGLKDTVWITHNVSTDASWQGFVYVPGAQVEATLDFGTEVPAAVNWDGNDLSGDQVPDGAYSYELIGTDAAGNQVTTNAVQITIDRRETTIDFDLSREYFSPNGDGEGDVVVVTPVLSVPTGIDNYAYQIVDRNGTTIMSGSGTGNLPSQIVWDGTGPDGTVLPEGEYAAVVDLAYAKGNTPRAVSPVVTIDFTIPTVALRASSSHFTPNGDGVEDTITFIPMVDPINEIVAFTGEVVGSNGRVAATASGVRPAGSVEWDGTSTTGGVAPDGIYVASLEVEHRNGTTRRAQTGSIALGTVEDTTPPDVALTLTPELFSPDGDGMADTVLVEISVTDQSPIASWEIGVVEPDGDVFYGYAGDGDPTGSFRWDGVNDAGQLVSSAIDYRVTYEVTDAVGNTARGHEVLTTDILTEERFGMRRILVDDIIFEGYTTHYLNWNKDLSERNVLSLDMLAAMLLRFPQYDVELHGHAVSVLYYDAEESDREHEEVLMPLSRGRVETIRDALVERGVDSSRLSLEWWGKLRPLVPFDDIEGRYVDRRVEFYLVRP